MDHHKDLRGREGGREGELTLDNCCCYVVPIDLEPPPTLAYIHVYAHIYRHTCMYHTHTHMYNAHTHNQLNNH